MSTRASGAAAAMSNLTLDASGKKAKPAATKPKKVVADSWEDDDDDDSGSDSDSGSAQNNSSSRRTDNPTSSSSGFAAPPPTPSSPTYGSDAPWQSMAGPDGAAEAKRPEKTDAVARRMIASALGVKAPKLTEEQKAYDRALRDKERKRREEERAAERRRQEEAEKAKASMWGD